MFELRLKAGVTDVRRSGMKRLLVFALVASIGNVSAVFAEESLLESGARHVQQLAVAESTTAAAPAATLPAGTGVIVAKSMVAGKKAAPALQQTQGNLTKSGMSTWKKAAILLGIGVGTALTFYAIDHNVVDVTPSSLGTRQD
jgi:hypothetical protein